MLIVDLLSYDDFFFSCYSRHRHLHSFPTRRSSDLGGGPLQVDPKRRQLPIGVADPALLLVQRHRSAVGDRKSTRLNSSHMSISYAVFCLKKKTKKSAKVSLMKTCAPTGIPIPSTWP